VKVLEVSDSCLFLLEIARRIETGEVEQDAKDPVVELVRTVRMENLICGIFLLDL